MFKRLMRRIRLHRMLKKQNEMYRTALYSILPYGSVAAAPSFYVKVARQAKRNANRLRELLDKDMSKSDSRPVNYQYQ